jgi:hypothetical protein
MDTQMTTKSIDIQKREQISCAGKYCPNQAIHKLKIIYINKDGWFCSNCSEVLLENGLVVQDNNGDQCQNDF